MITRFWLGQKGRERRIHWVSKEPLGLPKSEGGMGFRNFVDFNDVLLAKQCWRLIQDPNSLWARVFKARTQEYGSSEYPRRSPVNCNHSVNYVCLKENLHTVFTSHTSLSFLFLIIRLNK
ncbi:hypothetical protein FF1_034067 [Malus domestica]